MRLVVIAAFVLAPAVAGAAVACLFWRLSPGPDRDPVHAHYLRGLQAIEKFLAEEWSADDGEEDDYR